MCLLNVFESHRLSFAEAPDLNFYNRDKCLASSSAVSLVFTGLDPGDWTTGDDICIGGASLPTRPGTVVYLFILVFSISHAPYHSHYVLLMRNPQISSSDRHPSLKKAFHGGGEVVLTSKESSKKKYIVLKNSKDRPMVIFQTLSQVWKVCFIFLCCPAAERAPTLVPTRIPKTTTNEKARKTG